MSCQEVDGSLVLVVELVVVLVLEVELVAVLVVVVELMLACLWPLGIKVTVVSSLGSAVPEGSHGFDSDKRADERQRSPTHATQTEGILQLRQMNAAGD